MDLKECKLSGNFYYFRNIEGCNYEDYPECGWLNFYKRFYVVNVCSFKICSNDADVCSHVQVYNKKGVSMGIGLLPTCRMHNNEGPNLGKWLRTNVLKIDKTRMVKAKFFSKVLFFSKWRQELIQLGEIMFRENLDIATFNDVKYTFYANNFHIFDIFAGRSVSKWFSEEDQDYLKIVSEYKC